MKPSYRKGLPELGTANLHSILQPQIPQNCKRCSATANPQVCGNFSHFRNRKCTLHFRKLRPHCLLLFCPRDDLFYFWRSNFAIDQTLTSKKKVINSGTLTSNPEKKSAHFFPAVLPRNRQRCLLLCGFAVNFSFSPQILKYLR